jgi:hypothetical protein
MKIFVINISILLILAIGFAGCNDKKERQHTKVNMGSHSFENFASKPKDTSVDDRSPIRYQK